MHIFSHLNKCQHCFYKVSGNKINLNQRQALMCNFSVVLECNRNKSFLTLLVAESDLEDPEVEYTEVQVSVPDPYRGKEDVLGHSVSRTAVRLMGSSRNHFFSEAATIRSG